MFFWHNLSGIRLTGFWLGKNSKKKGLFVETAPFNMV
jgi:hypothetical protein